MGKYHVPTLCNTVEIVLRNNVGNLVTSTCWTDGVDSFNQHHDTWKLKVPHTPYPVVCCP